MIMQPSPHLLPAAYIHTCAILIPEMSSEKGEVRERRGALPVGRETRAVREACSHNWASLTLRPSVQTSCAWGSSLQARVPAARSRAHAFGFANVSSCHAKLKNGFELRNFAVRTSQSTSQPRLDTEPQVAAFHSDAPTPEDRSETDRGREEFVPRRHTHLYWAIRLQHIQSNCYSTSRPGRRLQARRGPAAPSAHFGTRRVGTDEEWGRRG